MNNKLAIDKNLPIHLPAGLSNASHLGVLFWESISYPSNFFFFLELAQSANIFSDTAINIALSLKSSDDRGQGRG